MVQPPDRKEVCKCNFARSVVDLLDEQLATLQDAGEEEGDHQWVAKQATGV